MKFFLPLFFVAVLASCASKPSKTVPFVGAAPTPVAPIVKNVVAPVERAAEKNSEAKGQVAELKNEVANGQKRISAYGDQLSKLISQGKADKAQLEALYGSLTVIRENADISSRRVEVLTTILKDQADELGEAKTSLNNALAQAFVSDTEAKRAYIDLKDRTNQVDKLAKRNDDLLLEVASAEQRSATYGKSLAILAGICILYVALRLAKAHPTTKPFLFWLP